MGFEPTRDIATYLVSNQAPFPLGYTSDTSGGRGIRTPSAQFRTTGLQPDPALQLRRSPQQLSPYDASWTCSEPCIHPAEEEGLEPPDPLTGPLALQASAGHRRPQFLLFGLERKVGESNSQGLSPRRVSSALPSPVGLTFPVRDPCDRQESNLQPLPPRSSASCQLGYDRVSSSPSRRRRDSNPRTP